jgi:hypothetical protein
VADVLTSKGYDVTLCEDVDLEKFLDEFGRFMTSIAAGSTVVFYFSGHGCQDNGTNYLSFPGGDRTGGSGVCLWALACGVRLPKLLHPRVRGTHDIAYPFCADAVHPLGDIVLPLCDQLSSLLECAKPGSVPHPGSVTVLLDACRSKGGLSTTAVAFESRPGPGSHNR